MNRRSTDPQRQVTRPLSLKLSVFVAVMCLVIGAILVFASYQIHGNFIYDQFAKRGETVASVASRYVDWNKIDDYYETGTKDAGYEQTLEDLRALADAEGAKYMYVIMPVANGYVYIYDTDTSDSYIDLGTYVDYEEFYGSTVGTPVIGEAIEPFFINYEGDELLSIYFPNFKSGGGFSGYLGVDYDINYLVNEQASFLTLLIVIALAITVVVTLVFYFILRRMVVRPIDKMERAAADYVVTQRADGMPESNELSSLEFNKNDEIQSLSVSLKGMDRTIREHILNLELANKRAATDSMTGLLNREAFTYQVSELLEGDDKGQAHTFMMIDLDNFKHINDTYGHVFGDEVILETASIIVSKFRPSDLISRFGGDEYAVYYRHASSLEEVEKRVQDVCEEVRNNVVGKGVSVTVSIGVAYVGHSDGCTFQDLYIMADAALYDAKHVGRDGYAFNVKNG